MNPERYRKLVEKFKELQRQCDALALDFAQERISGDYDEDQAGWLEDVQAKLEEMRDY